MTSPLVELEVLVDASTVEVQPTVAATLELDPGPKAVFETDASPILVEVDPPNVAIESDHTPVVVYAATRGSPGPPGSSGAPGGGIVELVAAVTLSGHRVVTPGDDGEVGYADALTAAHIHRPLLLTIGATMAGATATLVTQGPVTEPSWSWTPGLPIWLGANGALTQTIPPGAAFTRRVAEVIDATTIEYGPADPIASS